MDPVDTNLDGTPFGRYRLMRRIAVGGMGEVFAAQYTNSAGLESKAVLKRILPKLCDDPDFVEYFKHEGRVMSLLNHPNVVQTIELGRYMGRLFIAMQYIPGPSLVHLLALSLRHRKVFSIPLVLHFSLQLARAMAYIHSREDFDQKPLNIIHMDLSPHNVLVTPDGLLKVLDFGISRASGMRWEGRRRDFRGRTAYLAPEQLRGLPLDQRVDVFALGVMMYEMAVGRPLFRARNDRATVRRILEMPIPPPRTLRKECPNGFAEIVMSTLTRDRDARCPTAAGVEKALDRCLLDEGIVRASGPLRDEMAQLQKGESRYFDPFRVLTPEPAAPDDVVAMVSVRPTRPSDETTPPDTAQ